MGSGTILADRDGAPFQDVNGSCGDFYGVAASYNDFDPTAYCSVTIGEYGPFGSSAFHWNRYLKDRLAMRTTKIAFLCVMALWASTSQAQLRKCTGPDGKVTYSDVGCATEKKEAGVRGGTVTTMESSGLRKYASQSHVQVTSRNSVQTVGSRTQSSSQSSQSGYWKCDE